MKNLIKSLAILSSILFITISAHKSIWPSSDYLHNDDKSTCIQFQYLKGNNRTAEFRRIAATIFKTSSIEDNVHYTTSNIGFYELTKILGDYDTRINVNEVNYLLNANATVKAIIKQNSDGTVSCSIQNN